MTELVLLGGICALVFYWHNGLKARECAMKAARQSCQSADVQLLDQTVQISRQRFTRSHTGHLVLARQYGFEYCTDGEARFEGSVEIIAGRAGPVWLQSATNKAETSAPRHDETPSTNAQIINFKPRDQDPSNHA